jgi:ABC-type sugar transport system ATPase subunit/ribose/xylose/arabinose/galactoside ABC-type transport system permease subunit
MKNQPATVGPSLVQLWRVAKGFPGVQALEDVSLELQASSIHALLGENGAGKSTLINILSGVLQPDAGEFRLRGRCVAPADARAARALGVATVHQEADLFPDLSVAENVAFEHGWPVRAGIIAWPRLRAQTFAATQRLNCVLQPERLAASLSAAQRQLVGIAAALAQDAALLILDEPTSSLSQVETDTLFAHLRRFRDRGGAILYVSHRLEEIFQLADHATVLRDGRRIWSGPLCTTTSAQLIGWMVGRETLAPTKRTTPPTGRVSLACHGLTAADGSFRDVHLEARSGEILGLYGLIGAGRSEWAQAVFGLRAVRAGTLMIEGKTGTPQSPGDAARQGLAYLPEDRLRYGLCPTLSVRANAVLAALRRFSFGPFVAAARETAAAKTQVDQLAVRLRTLAQPLATLSGGNQQKVILGRWLACEPQTLILDEPTRGVDVGAKAEIHGLLRRLADAGRTIILISSDLPEILACSDRVGVFREGRLIWIRETATINAEEVGAAALPAAAAPLPGRSQPSRVPDARKHPWMHELGLLAAVLLLGLLLCWRTNTFWQRATLNDIGENAALLALCGLASGLVILAGGIDISLGSTMALGAATTGYLMQEGHAIALAVPAGLRVAALAGAVNAALTLLGRVHPIVVTLGTMSVYRGLTLRLIGSRQIYDVPASFYSPIHWAPLGIPAPVWLALLVVTAAWFVLGWTVPGRQVLALGSNLRAAERCGIHRGRVWLAVFTLGGLLAGVAGLLALGLAGGHLQSTDFEEKTLEAIGVAVVGGIAITGGRGSVWGICAAALLFRILEKGWVLLHISGYWQRTIVGSLLLLAILADQLWRQRGPREE